MQPRIKICAIVRERERESKSEKKSARKESREKETKEKKEKNTENVNDKERKKNRSIPKERKRMRASKRWKHAGVRNKSSGRLQRNKLQKRRERGNAVLAQVGMKGRTGYLVSTLSFISDGIDLLKIHSRPIAGVSWSGHSKGRSGGCQRKRQVHEHSLATLRSAGQHGARGRSGRPSPCCKG